MDVDEQTVHEIAERVPSVIRPDKIILFASAATGQMTRDSDVDLLIVEPDTSNQRDEYIRVSRAIRGLRYPFDVLFINTQCFEESKDVVGGIAYPASKYGKVIYDAA